MHVVPQNLLGNPAGDWIRSQVFGRRSTSALLGQSASLPEVAAMLPHLSRPEKLQAGSNITLAWNALGPVISSSAFVPYYIAASETFTVPEYKQALFTMPITVDGVMVVDGYLVEV